MRQPSKWTRAVCMALATLIALPACQGAPQSTPQNTPQSEATSTPAGAAVTPAATQPADQPEPGGNVAGDAARVIEDYLTARVEANVDAMINLSCADWEADARKEFSSLQGVKARLDGLSCAVDSTAGETALVACAGNIVANYNGEDRPLALDKRKFKLVADGGQWLMCGYE